MIQAVLFDFGGVLAEEGFRHGMMAIAAQNRIDPDAFYASVEQVIYHGGYVLGRTSEATFWETLRKKWRLSGSDADLRREILSRFKVRPGMIELARKTKNLGMVTAILSDQTNWLDELNLRDGIYEAFDRVFNSYYLHQSKRMKETFLRACAELGVSPGATVFVDDHAENCENALSAGLIPVAFVSESQIREQLGRLFRDNGLSGID
ncbi:MAG: HAD family phosphatase [Deltaproteobacteria bacterium]|nr:HAD family phosphatase [Deltaproteobacteria bacterium]